jgi:hypothetical protein
MSEFVKKKKVGERMGFSNSRLRLRMKIRHGLVSTGLTSY